MQNDRPIEDPTLRRALREVQKVMQRYNLAGAVMLVAPDEAAFSYKMDAPWSAITPDPATPLGFRLRAISREMGAEVAHARVEGAMHTICQLHDFATQTEAWMEGLMKICRDAGIDFVHTPHNGRPIPPLAAMERPAPLIQRQHEGRQAH